MRLLLLSNSSNFGAGYLDHAAAEIAQLFAGVRRVLFVPFALHAQADYAERARGRLAQLGLETEPLTEGPGAPAQVEAAEGVFVGGGNTFRLLDKLQRTGALEPLRRRVRGGVPYLGSSAGTVIAAPTLKTTNDMPIAEPASFQALGLVPFQINCHYLDADPASRHMGETREQRLAEFLEDNDVPVVGLREGAWLSVEGAPRPSVTLGGGAGARIFRRGLPPVEFTPPARLDGLAEVSL
ncbi:MAG TPA: dipeptidase PepE [Candidatus Polarisedimenticolaceae bacterium]|nr:dipeptidase PepE [Candidatus Polarisedimenticolaceae bacterium]